MIFLCFELWIGIWICCGGLGIVFGLKWEGCFVICGGWYGEYENGLFEFKLFEIDELFFGMLGMNWE